MVRSSSAVVLAFLAGCASPSGSADAVEADGWIAGAKESANEHCDGEDNDGDGSVDEDCDVCDRIVTRTRAFWQTATCVINGSATGTALVPLTIGGTTTYSTATAVTNYLASPGTSAQRRLGQQIVAGRLNVAAFYIGELQWHDYDNDGTDETISELLAVADGLYTSGTNSSRTSMATLLSALNSDGEAFGLWFDSTCVNPPEVCNGLDDDADGTVDENCSCQGSSAPSAPGVSVAEVDEGEGRMGLLCARTSDAEDPDGDPLTYALSWTVDGVAYADAATTDEDGDTISAAEAARGSEWTCTIVANDGTDDGDPGSATHTFSGPARAQYAFETVMGGIPYPSDMAVLPDGRLLISDFLGQINLVDPASAAVVGTESVLDVDQELRSIALHPEFGDGSHDWLYVWASGETDLYRFDVTTDPFTVTNGTVVLEASGGMSGGGESEDPIDTGGSGGALIFWSGETGATTLYLGIGPVAQNWDAQDDDNLGGKLLAFTVDDATGELSGGAVNGSTEDDRIAARGLRNPWRAGDCGAALCIADPGSNTYEEVQFYTGADMNFGYPVTEGAGNVNYDDPSLYWGDEDDTYADDDFDGSATNSFSNVPWVSGTFTSEGYGGRLDGWAFYGEFYDGWVRAAQVDGAGALTGSTVPVAHLLYVLKVVQVGDTIYALELGGTLRKLVLRADRTRVGEPGEALSATDWASGVSYRIRYALWSNGADKARVVVLPSGQDIDNSTSTWAYPDGTRIYKTFSVGGVNVETRVIEKSGDTWMGGVYKWDGSDAYLTEGFREDVTLGSGDTYTIPSTVLCAECHESERGREWPLGLEPFVLGNNGLADLASSLTTAPGVAPSPSGTANTRRVRGYLHANCAFCHNPAGITTQMSILSLDFTYNATIDTSLIAQYYEANPNAEDGDPIFDVASPTDSVLYRVIEDAQMPPITLWEADTSIQAPLATWIGTL